MGDKAVKSASEVVKQAVHETSSPFPDFLYCRHIKLEDNTC
jgi:hypothetical protein